MVTSLLNDSIQTTVQCTHKPCTSRSCVLILQVLQILHNVLKSFSLVDVSTQKVYNDNDNDNDNKNKNSIF